MLNEINKMITGNAIDDCVSILQKYNNTITLRHTIAVAAKSREIAKDYGVDKNKAEKAAYLHDISVVIPRKEYADICLNHNVQINELEESLPILLHQKVSQIIAREIFKINDSEILSAISCHTTLKPNPSKLDMVLFVADKLKWDQGGLPPYYDILKNALNDSLESACLVYIDYIIDNKMIIKPHPDLLLAQKNLKNQVL